MPFTSLHMQWCRFNAVRLWCLFHVAFYMSEAGWVGTCSFPNAMMCFWSRPTHPSFSTLKQGENATVKQAVNQWGHDAMRHNLKCQNQWLMRCYAAWTFEIELPLWSRSQKTSAHIYIFTKIHIHTYVYINIYTYIHAYIHSFLPSFHSFIRSFIHSFIHSLTHSLIHSFIHSFIQTYIHTYIHIYIYISRCKKNTRFLVRGLGFIEWFMPLTKLDMGTWSTVMHVTENLETYLER